MILFKNKDIFKQEEFKPIKKQPLFLHVFYIMRSSLMERLNVLKKHSDMSYHLVGHLRQ